MNLSANIRAQLDQAEGLIFDMDGTLVDSMPLHYRAWSAVAEKYKLPFSKERFYQLGGVPTFETLQILSAEAGIEIDIPAAKQMKETLYRSQLDNVQPIVPILNIAQHYYGKKPLAIATGSSRIGAEKVLTQLNLMSLFESVSTADDVDHHKPAPDVFLHAANAIRIEPNRCVGFEDTDLGVQSITQAQMIAIDVRTIL